MLLIFLLQQGAAVVAMPHRDSGDDGSDKSVVDVAVLAVATESSDCHTAATDQDNKAHGIHNHGEQSGLDECNQGCRGDCNDCVGLSLFITGIDGVHSNFEPGHPQSVVYTPARILRAPENPFRPPILH